MNSASIMRLAPVVVGAIVVVFAALQEDVPLAAIGVGLMGAPGAATLGAVKPDKTMNFKDDFDDDPYLT